MTISEEDIKKSVKNYFMMFFDRKHCRLKRQKKDLGFIILSLSLYVVLLVR